MRIPRNHEETGGHGDRPWVFFMVDCFFLITEFFVLTFQFKQNENSLPRQLPLSGGGRPPSAQVVSIHVVRQNGVPSYSFMGVSLDAARMEQRLANAGQQTTVRVSYDSETKWDDVIAVFNTCSKLGIVSCGLVPLRR